MLRIGAIQSLPQLLEEMKVDADTTLAAVGLTPSDFDDADNLITYLQLERLFLECEHRTGCDYFGMLLGARSRLAEMGLSGRIARCAATAGEALDSFARHLNLHDSAAIVSLTQSGDFARFVYGIHEPGIHDTRHFQMGAMAIVFNIITDLCGPDWRPTVVHLAGRAPSKLRPIYQFFQAPLHFDADESAIVFKRAWLDRPVPAIDDAFRQSVAAENLALRAGAFEDLPTLARGIIRKQLSSGQCSIESVADALSIHRRTLDRRLAQHGTSYLALRTAVKTTIAQQLLRETNLPVQQIAEFLGFSSAANFATSFRRVTGRTPMQFRSGTPST
jgi:AraC-like DNA-binding protein